MTKLSRSNRHGFSPLENNHYSLMGFSFVELNVAIALFMVAAVSIIGILFYCATAAKKATELAQCVNLAKSKMAELIYMKANEIQEVPTPVPFASPFENYRYTIEKIVPTDPNLSGSQYKELKITAQGLTGTRFSLVGLLTRPFSWAKGYWAGIGDQGYSIQPTSYGGYIITGRYGLSGNGKIWVIKTTSDGAIEWQRVFGSDTGPPRNDGLSVIQSSDGGYVIRALYADTDSKLLLFKLSSNGNNILWKYLYDAYQSLGSFSSNIFSVRQTFDGGYILAARNSNNKILVLKLTPQGMIEWQKTYGVDGKYYSGFFIKQTLDRGYILAGYRSPLITLPSGEQRPVLTACDSFCVIKLKPDTASSKGEIQWQKNFIANRIPTMIIETQNKEYILGFNHEDGRNFIIFMLNNFGETVWVKKCTYAAQNLYLRDLQITGDNNFAVLINYFTAFNLICKFNYNGEMLWQKCYRTSDWAWTMPFCIQSTADEGYIFSAFKTEPLEGISSSVFVLKADSDGSCPPLDVNPPYGGSLSTVPLPPSSILSANSIILESADMPISNPMDVTLTINTPPVTVKRYAPTP